MLKTANKTKAGLFDEQKEQHFIEIEILCNIRNVFTVTLIFW